jgi:hypothetical protein
MQGIKLQCTTLQATRIASKSMPDCPKYKQLLCVVL